MKTFFALLLLVCTLATVNARCSSNINCKACNMVCPVAYAYTGSTYIPNQGAFESKSFNMDVPSGPNANRPVSCTNYAVSGGATITKTCGCTVWIKSDGVYGVNYVLSADIFAVSLNTTCTLQPVSLVFTSAPGFGGSGSLPPSDCSGYVDQ